MARNESPWHVEDVDGLGELVGSNGASVASFMRLQFSLLPFPGGWSALYSLSVAFAHWERSGEILCHR